jgi:chorismate synthase
MNTFGRFLRITTFGESHGVAIGVVLDGVPAGIDIDLLAIQADLDKRKPGQSSITTQRMESDRVQIISGVFNGLSTGTPITLLIPNEDQQSSDYSDIAKSYRPNHADYTYEMKYGIRDFRGGGRSSARETACRVAAGAIAKAMLKKLDIKVFAWVNQVGGIKVDVSYKDLDFDLIESNIVRCPHEPSAALMLKRIEEVRDAGDTIGGVVSFVAKGVPVGLGSPLYAKLHADLAAAMMSINAVKGFDYGLGFDGVEELGSAYNDKFLIANTGKIGFSSNNSGGIQGGISNGEDVYGRVLFKPVATIMQSQETVNIAGEAVTLEPKGRHDPCVLPRAVPIVSAMLALVLADHILLSRMSKW